ncbi:MAG: purine-nucleoside phosphorylase [Clostridiales bacterium]|jgi:purine-nucleoside phosphorylase|nr:purine-nucleoside phosphorylase [Clostridiales bacterium]
MTPTPHNQAKKGDIAETVLMPGDPLRAKFIAETFLTDAAQFNQVRGMFGFTGLYKGKRVSVMGSGMGIPSITLYTYELYNFYGVNNIIRIGTAGSISRNLKVKDICIAQAACTDSGFAAQFGLLGSYAPTASFSLLEKAVAAARHKDVSFQVGNVLSTDIFYHDNKDALTLWSRMGVLAVEMESAGLYMNAARAGKNALCILTISDEVFEGIETTSEERQTGFTKMMEIALETAVNA